MFYFLILLKIILTATFRLSPEHYSTNVLDIYVGPCPQHIDCPVLLYEANAILQVPGTYRHINWHYNTNYTNYDDNFNNNSKNEIFFVNAAYPGATYFVSNNNTIQEFDVIINPYKIDETTLFNIILHEMMHVYLLDHDNTKISISSFVLVLNNDIIVNSSKRLKLTKDDCLGLYEKLINDIIKTDLLYFYYLYKMKNIYCNNIA
jgi:hypothetical protein